MRGEFLAEGLKGSFTSSDLVGTRCCGESPHLNFSYERIQKLQAVSLKLSNEFYSRVKGKIVVKRGMILSEPSAGGGDRK